jgi:hypothetical protein
MRESCTPSIAGCLRRLAFVIICIAFACTSSDAGEIGDFLAARMKKAAPDELIPVMIRPVGAESGMSLTDSIVGIYATRAERHREIVKELRRRAESSQPPIVLALSSLQFKDRTADVRQLWIDNVVTAQITPSAIAELATHPSVSELLYLPPVEFARTGSTPAVDAAGEADGTVVPGLRAIKADSLWAMGYTGKGRLVASIDTGVDGDHVLLADKWRGNNGYSASESWFCPPSASTVPFAVEDAHGTMTMGIMVALQDRPLPGDPDLDTMGAAYDAQWITAGVIDVGGANILEAMQWVADPDGDPNTELDVPDVVNNSWGIRVTSGYGCSDVFWHAIDNVEAAGAAMVFAAGNEGLYGTMTIRNPADRASSETNAFSVGMIDANHTSFPLDPRSSRGPSDCDGSSIKPEVVAPGVGIKSTFPGSYTVRGLIGTSFAVAHVSGGIALLREYNPNATVDEIKLALLNSALDLGPAGPDNEYGYGLINLAAAMRAMPPNDQPSLYIKRDYYTRPAPGSSTDMVIVLRSAGTAVSGVSVTVASEDPHLGVTMGTSAFGDFAVVGDTAGNFGSPFVLSVSPFVLEGERLPLRFEITGDGGYSRVVHGVLQVGPSQAEELFTHDAGNFQLTVSAFGTFGHVDDGIAPRVGGVGYLYGGDPTQTLYEGAFLVGIGPDQVSDNARDVLYFPDVDFQVDPGGLLTVWEPGPEHAEETRAAFSDASAENPIGVFVEQRTLVDDSPETDDYLIAEYTIHNRSGTVITDLYAGLFFDWDFPFLSAQRDGGGFEPVERVGWMRHRDQNMFRGLAVLTPGGSLSYRYFEANPLLYDGFTESEKWEAMTGGTSHTTPSAAGDGAHLIAAGPFLLLPDDAVTVAFAIIGATSEADLIASAKHARQQYAHSVDVDILPQQCPNVIKINNLTPIPRPLMAGVDRTPTLPVSVLGRADFDVRSIDVSTVRLAGVVSHGHRFEDISRPVIREVGACECTAAGGDGFEDLTLRFDADDVLAAIGGMKSGEARLLQLSLRTLDRSPLYGTDCVTYRTHEGSGRDVTVTEDGKTELYGNTPNPFNLSTSITYTLAKPAHVELEIFDLLGRRVATLVEGQEEAGRHQVAWSGTDAKGHTVATGIYVYRLVAGDYTSSRKMLLLK